MRGYCRTLKTERKKTMDLIFFFFYHRSNNSSKLKVWLCFDLLIKYLPMPYKTIPHTGETLPPSVS